MIKDNRLIPTILIIFYGFVMFTGLIILKITPVAAQSLSLSISPPLLEVLIRPGKTITQVYKIHNNGDSTVVTLRILEYYSDGLKYNSDFVPENWISLQNLDIAFNKPFLLGANEERQIILKVNPPQEIAEKDYYRVLLFSTTPNPSIDNSETRLSQNLGSILLVNVTNSGIKTKAGQITSFKLPLIIDSFTALSTDITLQNSGKTYFRPLGEVKLTGPFAKGSFKINPNVYLAGENKLLITEANNLNHTLNLSGFYLGKYQVSVDLTLDDSKVKISQTRTTYALPWKLSLIIITFFTVKVLFFRKRK